MSIWCKYRSKYWWNGVLARLYGETWWRKNIRMTHDTFNILCGELQPYIERKDTHFHRPVSVEERVAVMVWRLATNIEYRTMGQLFGLGRSTIGEIVLETCEVIAEQLLPKYVHVPNDICLCEIVDGFRLKWGFPQTVGALDGTHVHVPILQPVDSASDYYNRKGFYSVLMQALVDFHGRFINVNIGWPGKVHDARVFANSSCYKDANNGKLFPNWTTRIRNVDVPLIVLGDPAYPLLPWLMWIIQELVRKNRYLTTGIGTNVRGNWEIERSLAMFTEKSGPQYQECSQCYRSLSHYITCVRYLVISVGMSGLLQILPYHHTFVDPLLLLYHLEPAFIVEPILFVIQSETHCNSSYM